MRLYPPIKQAASCVSVADTHTISGFSIESTDCSTYSVTSILRNRNGSCLFCEGVHYLQLKRLITKQFERSKWSMPDDWLSIFQSRLRSLARSPCSKRQGDLHFVMKERWRNLSKRSRNLSQEILRKWDFEDF